MAENKNSFFNPKFVFCGFPMIPNQEKASRPWVNEMTTKNGGKRLVMNFGVKNGSNCVYVESSGFKNDIIKTYDRDGATMDVRWDKRFDEETLKKVANRNKFIVDLGERKEFLTEWDMMEYLKEVLPDYKDKIVVRGRFTRSPASDKSKEPFYDHYEVQRVYKASDEMQPQHRLTIELYYDRDSLDDSDLKDTKKIHFHGYTPTYIRSESKTLMTPINMEFNVGAYDMTDEKAKRQYDLRMMNLKVKGRGYFHAKWDVMVINGAEEVPFSIDSLTDMQRAFIEAGAAKLEDYFHEGVVYGPKEKEFRLFQPNLTGAGFDNGITPADFTAREFEDLIYVPPVDEKMDEVEARAKDDEEDDSDIDGSNGEDITLF